MVNTKESTLQKGNKKKGGNGSNRKESLIASTVMFVQWTAKGRLIARMKEEEERLAQMTNFKVKYQEQGGTPLWMMFSTKLGEGLDCGRDGCYTCKQDDEGKVDCFASSVVYQSTCQLCHPSSEGKPSRGMDKGEGTYTGETSRSVFERVGEHYGDVKSLEKDSHIVKHWFTTHHALDEAPSFKFKILGRYNDCMTRQLKEAVILMNKPNSLNSKGEFGRCEIPRLTIELEVYRKKVNEIEDRKRE